MPRTPALVAMSALAALTVALPAVAQSRLTQIHGAREDTTQGEQSRKLGYERMKRLNQMWLTEEGPSVELGDLPSLATEDVFDDLQLIRAKLNTTVIRCFAIIK